jgi:hypothetical protein
MWASVQIAFEPKLEISVEVDRDWAYYEWEAKEIIPETTMETQNQVNKHPKWVNLAFWF